MSFKILHTADWHLGQSFKQKSRIDEHKLFVEWLLDILLEEKIDAILIAGDIFDVVNPSIEAMDIYHNFLVKAFQLNVEVIVIGGNHDSAARLNTTGSLLKLLNVHIIGGEANALGEIIPLKKKNSDKTQAVVVAVPYLRDGDVRKILEGESIKDAKLAFAESVKLHYGNLLKLAKSNFPKIPIIGTAHLYISGSSVSDPTNEKMHTVGTLGQISSASFGSEYSYIALGHIHKPQEIKHPSNVKIKYSGSPIPLSFSERDDQKEITLLEIESENISYKSIPVENNRRLKRFKGTASEIIEDIKSFKVSTKLPTWAEIIITEKINFLEFNKEIDALAESKGIEILEKMIEIPKTENENVRNKFILGVDNNPLDDIHNIFTIRCEKEGLNEENIKEIMPLFEKVLAEVKNTKI